jgi:phosphotransferase system enzyme I (PtsP)
VKALLSKADLGAFRKVLSAIRSHNSLAASLREPLSSWAREHGLPV